MAAGDYTLFPNIGLSDYPRATGSRLISLSNTGTGANTAINISLSPTTNTMWVYMTTLIISGFGATPAVNVTATVNNIYQFGNLSIAVAIPAGTTNAMTPIVMTFPWPIPANTVNESISLSVPAFGSGNTAAYAALFGFEVDTAN